MPSRLLGVILMFLLVAASHPTPTADTVAAQKILSTHWVPGWGFRDELNPNDTDYQNFWNDNSGKILASSVITDDSLDASRALSFILNHTTGSFYQPELVVNSSLIHPNIAGETSSITNRIVLLSENTSTELKELSVGDYYAGPWTAGYLGGDRIWYGGAAHRAISAAVVNITNGYSKVSYFSFDGLSFYTYLNATVRVGDPYVRVSLQVQPIDSTFGSGDHIDLQVFAAPARPDLVQYSFENATLFDAKGNPIGPLPFNNAAEPRGNGMIVAYSNRTSVFDQDSVAIAFNSSRIASVEHWFQNPAFDGQSWIGLGYDATTSQGQMSPPVYADVYPIQHLDYRLLSDTTRYLASNQTDVAVSPPVSFGFVAWGLALASHQDPENQSLRGNATGYWNFYYDRYKGTETGTAYARSTSLFALAGFELFGKNATVENFTREFVEAFPGTSIEEFGWATAALHTMCLYDKSECDQHPLQNIEGSFVPGGSYYLTLKQFPAKVNSTFEFGEAAEGLLIAGVLYNSPAVLWAMDAVFASNSSGTLLNSPVPSYRDLANTETLPAYILSTLLFNGAMWNRTGFWIEWTHGLNITSITYSEGQLRITAISMNGTLAVGTPHGSQTYRDITGRSCLVLGRPLPRFLQGNSELFTSSCLD